MALKISAKQRFEINLRRMTSTLWWKEALTLSAPTKTSRQQQFMKKNPPCEKSENNEKFLHR
jgi:hypothetical protein